MRNTVEVLASLYACVSTYVHVHYMMILLSTIHAHVSL